MSRASVRALAIAHVLLSAAAAPALAQAGALAELSRDTVAVGEAFELRVSFRVAPGRVVYFPDTLTATDGMESLAPVRWSAESVPAGGSRLLLTYALIAFRDGTVPVPGLDVLTVPAADEPGLDPLPGGSLRGRWNEAPLRASTGVQRTRFARSAVWVTPVFTPEHFLEGVEPRPSEDVLGSSWHWPSLSLALLFSLVLGGVVVSTTREWRASRRPTGPRSPDLPPATLDAARRAALEELDRLVDRGLHRDGRMQELYTRSSAIVRGYVELLDTDWGPDLTSSELMLRLEARVEGAAVAGLAHEMGAAEVVKFGRLRPPQTVAERHVGTLRAWLEASAGGGT